MFLQLHKPHHETSPLAEAMLPYQEDSLDAYVELAR